MNGCMFSPCELTADKRPDTYDTLRHLAERYEGAALLCGSDELGKMEKKWKDFGKILKEFGIVCVRRGDNESNGIIRKSRFLLKYSGKIRIMDATRYESVSSSLVRRFILETQRNSQNKRAGSEIKRLVPAKIYGYVMELAKRRCP